jgi:hypothetical protein
MIMTTARLLLILSMLGLSGCAGAIIGTTVDVAIEVVKIPFKVGGAIIDVMTDDDEDEEAQED